jgi:predicted NBD/HSP70 family sugar kinase
VRDYLQNRLRVPVYLENTGRAAAFAEYHYGSPDIHGSHCLLFVKIDEGIAINVVTEGKLYYGQRMAAGEFGQMVIAESRGPQRHDRPGCLEKLAANPALWERYQAVSGKRSAPPGDYTARAQQVCHLAMAGDADARKTVSETCRYLGIGIANVIWGLDPDAVVIDGVITEAWPLVSAAIQGQFADGQEFLNFRNLLLRPSALGGHAAIIGAITLPFAGLFSSGEIVGKTLEEHLARVS